MAVISIVAQISVLPLTLYYFGQFPTLFLVANVVIIPLTTCVLILGMVTLAFNFINFDIAVAFGKLLQLLIETMNRFTALIASFDTLTIKNIPFTLLLCILAVCFLGVWGIAVWMLYQYLTAESSEITVSWFSILNSFFIITFASSVSKIWDSKYNPNAAVKYGLGLIIMSIGFGLLAFGSYGVVEGVKVSMVWLVLAYLFHTLGELCLSPVGLSYVSKLVPARMIAFMFGMWYLAIAIGNKLAAILGGQIENITKEYSLSTFFLIFTIVPTVAGLIVISLNPILKKLMHGVK